MSDFSEQIVRLFHYPRANGFCFQFPRTTHVSPHIALRWVWPFTDILLSFSPRAPNCMTITPLLRRILSPPCYRSCTMYVYALLLTRPIPPVDFVLSLHDLDPHQARVRTMDAQPKLLQQPSARARLAVPLGTFLSRCRSDTHIPQSDLISRHHRSPSPDFPIFSITIPTSTLITFGQALRTK